MTGHKQDGLSALFICCRARIRLFFISGGKKGFSRRRKKGGTRISSNQDGNESNGIAENGGESFNEQNSDKE